MNHIIKSACIIIMILPSFGMNAKEVVINNGAGLPDYIVAELKKIALEAGEYQIDISSKQRTVRKQVEIMLDYYITCAEISNEEDKNSCGISLARQIYDVECHAGFDVYDPTSTRQKNVKLMTEALMLSLLGLGNKRVCMNHVVIPGIKTDLIAVDIKPSSISNNATFYDAIINTPKVVQFFYPPIKDKPLSQVKDAAFHLAFMRK